MKSKSNKLTSTFMDVIVILASVSVLFTLFGTLMIPEHKRSLLPIEESAALQNYE